ncbi:hypothetical protein PRZ48_007818 [Zasmidium cellare]|uniref:P-type Na(+) transporter n=1 Tax=Zasmidium cellare TaxID=395010 RepID=A0ABR0EKC6_ZASCE|nr:hypothetical protein PRZ48_007818 [Zasmidium cellare]
MPLDGARSTNATPSLNTTLGDVTDENIHRHAHTLTTEQVETLLGTDTENGLSSDEAARRLERYGQNYLKSSGGFTWWDILIRQVSNSLTIVLVIAMALSYGTQDYIEGGVITAVICLNVVVGFFQDYRAEQTIARLQALAAPDCKVIRDGGLVLTVRSKDVVPGDVVVLPNGSTVPADIRLVTTVNMADEEALLTGEAKLVTKDSEFLSQKLELPLGDRRNMAYSSTLVARGRGTGIVIATGMKTEVGNVADQVKPKADGDESDPNKTSRTARYGQKILRPIKNALGLTGTPLTVKLSWFALFLLGLAILLAIIVFSVNLWDLDDETVIYGICVAVAVIPESLIAVLTITMAVGAKAMASGNVIVRQTRSLEAIGGVTDICSDKTGTLTQGKMLARKAMLPSGRFIVVEGESNPFDPTVGILKVDDVHLQKDAIFHDLELHRFFQIIALCNLAQVNEPREDEASWTAAGEPTEIALQVMAMRAGSGKRDTIAGEAMNLLAEHDFDSSIKRMSVVYDRDPNGGITVFTKGATEVLLPLLNVDEATAKSISAQVEVMAAEGLRVLCLAHRTLAQEHVSKVGDRGFIEQSLEFAGIVGIYDPPRAESAGAVRKCQVAGITVHMVTGDHLKTATTIAREIGILAPSVPGSSGPNAVMLATDFDKMSPEAIDAMKELPLVLARCSPETKSRMLSALKRRGKYCAMTGDGVNDAPALKSADVGVAMGSGSDVSKESADMVITDDNFASIISAIREGRRLFDNIRKFLLHLLISNIAQVVLLLVGLAFKDRNDVSVFPLSPLEILFANLVSSSFLAIGLGLEEESADVMTRPPHPMQKGVFTVELIIDKFIYGTFMGSLCLISFVIVAYGVGNGDLGDDCNHSYNDTCGLPYRARGTAYSILTVLLSVMAWEAKHLDFGLFNMYPNEGKRRGLSFFSTVTRNRFLFWAVMAGLVTPFPIIYIPVVNRVVFRHAPLSWEWGLVFGSVVCFVALVESWKAIKRARNKRRARRDDGGDEKSAASV